MVRVAKFVHDDLFLPLEDTLEEIAQPTGEEEGQVEGHIPDEALFAMDSDWIDWVVAETGEENVVRIMEWKGK